MTSRHESEDYFIRGLLVGRRSFASDDYFDEVVN